MYDMERHACAGIDRGSSGSGPDPQSWEHISHQRQHYKSMRRNEVFRRSLVNSGSHPRFHYCVWVARSRAILDSTYYCCALRNYPTIFLKYVQRVRAVLLCWFRLSPLWNCCDGKLTKSNGQTATFTILTLLAFINHKDIQ